MLIALVMLAWAVVPHIVEAIANGRGVWIGDDGDRCTYWRWGERYSIPVYRCPWFLHPDEAEERNTT